MTLTIDRRKWLRGEDFNSALLRSDDKKMCCLGFFCLSRDIRKIADVSEPVDLSYQQRQRIPELFDNQHQNHVCEKLMVNNDSPELSEKVRETRITKWFKKIGVNVKFIN